MLSVDDMISSDGELLVSDGLTVGTVSEPSQLFLHGFGDEFPDTIVCPYCGKPLAGEFSASGAFIASCDCDDYAEETSIRHAYQEAVRLAADRLEALATRAKSRALSFVELNKGRYLESKKATLESDLSKIAAFRGLGTN